MLAKGDEGGCGSACGKNATMLNLFDGSLEAITTHSAAFATLGVVPLQQHERDLLLRRLYGLAAARPSEAT